VSGERILVVDDNHPNTKLLRFLLVAEGYDVRTAYDAQEALAVLAGFTPALILMDVQMPGMDGLTLTRLLKADPLTAGILIVAVSAYAMKGDEEKALAAGCDGYVTKPIDTDAFPAQLRGYLRKGASSSA
jgi:CheY-like chemotaxis protein